MKVSKNSKYQTGKNSIKLTKNPNDQTGAQNGTLLHFQHPLLQNIKKLKGSLWRIFFWKKSLTMPKKLKGGPFGIFQHPSVAKHQKIEGGPSGNFCSKKISEPKNWKGPFSLSRYCMLRGKRGKTSLIQFAGPIDVIVELLRTILVSSCGLKKKSHYNSRVSLHEAPTNKNMEFLKWYHWFTYQKHDLEQTVYLLNNNPVSCNFLSSANFFTQFNENWSSQSYNFWSILCHMEPYGTEKLCSEWKAQFKEQMCLFLLDEKLKTGAEMLCANIAKNTWWTLRTSTKRSYVWVT